MYGDLYDAFVAEGIDDLDNLAKVYASNDLAEDNLNKICEDTYPTQQLTSLHRVTANEAKVRVTKNLLDALKQLKDDNVAAEEVANAKDAKDAKITDGETSEIGNKSNTAVVVGCGSIHTGNIHQKSPPSDVQEEMSRRWKPIFTLTDPVMNALQSISNRETMIPLEKDVVDAPHEQVVSLMTTLIQTSIPSSDCQQHLISRVQCLYQLIVEIESLQHERQCGMYLLIDYWFEVHGHLSSAINQPPQSMFKKLQFLCNETVSKGHILEVCHYRCYRPSTASFNFIGRAFCNGDDATIKLLLEYGVDPNWVGKYVSEDQDRRRSKSICFDGFPLAYMLSKISFLHPTMTMDMRFKMIRVLFFYSKYPVDVNVFYRKGMKMATPLHDLLTHWHKAVEKGESPDRKIYQDIADFLVKNGANPDVREILMQGKTRIPGDDTAREWSIAEGFNTSKWPQMTASNVMCHPPTETAQTIRSPQATVYHCSLHDYRGFHDRAFAFFLKSDPCYYKLKNILADADPTGRLHHSVVIDSHSPCKVVVVGNMKYDHNAGAIKAKVKEEFSELIASVAESDPIEVNVSAAVDLKNDVSLQNALEQNKVTYYSFLAGKACMVVLSYFKGNEHGCDVIKELLLQIKPSNHVVEDSKTPMKGMTSSRNDPLEPIVSPMDHGDAVTDLERSFEDRLREFVASSL